MGIVQGPEKVNNTYIKTLNVATMGSIFTVFSFSVYSALLYPVLELWVYV
jgi:hypothetical protein